MMRQPAATAVFPAWTRPAAPALIASGLAILLSRAAWPELPTATAFAFIALGTTIITILRFAKRPIIASHFFVYALLYLLYVGAICDSAARGVSGGLSLIELIDLGVSAGVMAFVARLCIALIVRDDDFSAC